MKIKPNTPVHINPLIFKAYDIRELDKLLPDEVCFYLGKGYGTLLRRIFEASESQLWVVIGGGVRLSTPRMKRAYMEGLRSSGVNVYYIKGIVSTPNVNFAIALLGADAGVNVTASHNSSEYNGFKQSMRTNDGLILSLTQDQMLKLKSIVLNGDYLSGQGESREIDADEIIRYHNEFIKADVRLGFEMWNYLLERYKAKDKALKELLDKIAKIEFSENIDKKSWAQIRKELNLPEGFKQPITAVKRPYKQLIIALDFNNGSSISTQSIYTNLGADIVIVKRTNIPDGSFPVHKEPNPLRSKTRAQLEDLVKKLAAKEEQKQVIGAQLDEDGDRWIILRSDRLMIPGDRALAIQAKIITNELRKRNPKVIPRFMGEVEFSTAPIRYIEEKLNAEFILTKKGFALIKEAMATLKRAIDKGLSEIVIHGNKINLAKNSQPAYLAAELSGHQMAWEEYFIDDGTLAINKLLRAAVVAQIEEGKSLIDLDNEVPRYCTSEPELEMKVPHKTTLEQKEEFVQEILDVYRKRGHQIVEVDGGIIHFTDKEGRWYGKVSTRKSNTQPAIKASLEGIDDKSLQRIEDDFFTVVSQVSTKAVSSVDLNSSSYIRENVLPRLKHSKRKL